MNQLQLILVGKPLIGRIAFDSNEPAEFALVFKILNFELALIQTFWYFGIQTNAKKCYTLSEIDGQIGAFGGLRIVLKNFFSKEAFFQSSKHFAIRSRLIFKRLVLNSFKKRTNRNSQDAKKSFAHQKWMLNFFAGKMNEHLDIIVQITLPPHRHYRSSSI